ncbi:MAG: hypothetical protein JEZ12_20735 [Desulfobacterium sp.]|nr:hypothetical protein [Desulfobacterium sp.]
MNMIAAEEMGKDPLGSPGTKDALSPIRFDFNDSSLAIFLIMLYLK